MISQSRSCRTRDRTPGLLGERRVCLRRVLVCRVDPFGLTRKIRGRRPPSAFTCSTTAAHVVASIAAVSAAFAACSSSRAFLRSTSDASSWLRASATGGFRCASASSGFGSRRRAELFGHRGVVLDAKFLDGLAVLTCRDQVLRRRLAYGGGRLKLLDLSSNARAPLWYLAASAP